MNKKCIGCGAFLQTERKEEIGYTNHLESSLCERCFRIKHYGEYKMVLKENKDFIPILEKINETKDLVLLVADLFFLNENFDLIKEKLKNNPILLVLTKRDLLPKSLYEEGILDYMNQFGIPFVDKIIISIKNYHYDELMELIEKHKRSENVYVVGYTNAGKSTMINHMIYHYSSLEREITTSMLPSTTLDEIRIPLKEGLTLIDTPGILESGSMVNFVSGKVLKQILPKKEVRPLTFQLKVKTFFEIKGLLLMEVDGKTNLTFFLSNTLPLERKYENIDNPEFEVHEFEIQKPVDIVVSGFGFVKVTMPSRIVVRTLKGVKVYTRESLI